MCPPASAPTGYPLHGAPSIDGAPSINGINGNRLMPDCLLLLDRRHLAEQADAEEHEGDAAQRRPPARLRVPPGGAGTLCSVSLVARVHVCPGGWSERGCRCTADVNAAVVPLLIIVNDKCIVATQFHRGASGETSVVERVLLTSDEDSMFIYKVCWSLDTASVTAQWRHQGLPLIVELLLAGVALGSSVWVQCLDLIVFPRVSCVEQQALLVMTFRLDATQTVATVKSWLDATDAGAGDAAAGARRQVFQPPRAEGRCRRHRAAGAPRSSTSHIKSHADGQTCWGLQWASNMQPSVQQGLLLPNRCAQSITGCVTGTSSELLLIGSRLILVLVLLCRRTCRSARRAFAPTWS